MNSIKTFTSLVIILLITTLGVKAQEQERVHEQIFKAEYKIATNKNEDPEIRKIASFKVDAISYLKSKTLAELTQNSKQLTSKQIDHINKQLDTMAYNMHEFVELFRAVYNKMDGAGAKENIIYLFRKASLQNPLYKDTDTNLIHAYSDRNDYITQFSLDTNWVKALKQIKERLKQVKQIEWIITRKQHQNQEQNQ